MFARAKYLTYLLTFSIAGSASLFAQNASKSPFSFFGMGEPAVSGFVQDIANGGTMVARRGKNSFNMNNPASYAALRYTVFEGGGRIDLGRRLSAENSSEFSNAGFQYFGLAFPIKAEKAGMAFGLAPVSHRGFDLLSSGDTGVNAYEGSFLGKGDLSRAYIGIGVEPIKGLSIGLNAGGVFGSFQEVSVLRYINNPKRFGFYDQSNAYFSGLNLDAGVQYNIQNKNELQQTFGAAIKLPYRLKQSRDRLVRSFNDPDFLSSPDFFAYDTVLFESGSEGRVQMPLEWTIGYGVSKENKWNISAEYQWSQWSSLNNQGLQGNFADAQRMAAGIWFVPGKVEDFKTPYFKKVRYSLGGRTQQMPWIIDGQQVRETGMMIGFGLPVFRTITLTGGKESLLSHVNIALEVFQREGGENLQENYFRMNFGFTFCDKWFIKRKYL